MVASSIQTGTAGNDILYGDDFDNQIKSLDGDDRVYGYDGADTIWGGNGNDDLNGNAGNDTIYGENGDDRLYGGYGNDKLYGGSGNDYLYGHEDDNYLDGGAGNDVLYGGMMNDKIFGGSGDDELYGFGGDDFLGGGLGNDTYYFSNQGFGHDIISETNESTNSNTPLFTANIYDYLENYSYSRSNNDLFIRHSGGKDSIKIVDYFLYNIQASRVPIFDFYNGEFSSFITGTNLNDNIVGTSIADVIDGGVGADSINSGDGDDAVLGGAGSDTINGGAGYDWIWGQDGDDVIDGGYGADVIIGGKGNDTMYSGGGSDEDTYRFYTGDGVDTVIDLDDRWLRGDFLEFVQANSVQAVFTKLGSDLVVSGYGLTIDKVIVKQYFDTSTYASNKRFVLKDKTMLSNDVKLTVMGTVNADVLKGSEYADVIQGLDGNDVLYGYLGNDSLLGGKGNDTLFGHDGKDGLNGDAGNDVLNGGKGDDTLYGGITNDSDSYIINKGDGFDSIIDLDDTSAKDTIRFIKINESSAKFVRKGEDLIITGYGSSTDSLRIVQYFKSSVYAHNKQFQFADSTLTLQDMQSGSKRFALNGTVNNETIYGSKVADLIKGLGGNDVLQGYDGNDSLMGGLGHDTLFGGMGNDGLNGESGNDVLNGGKGNDTLYGGTGNDADSYIFYKGDGVDIVVDTDDTSAIDTLRFINVQSSATTFTRLGADIVVAGYGDSTDKVIVKQFFSSTVNAANKQFQFADTTLNANQVLQLVNAMNSLTTVSFASSGFAETNTVMPDLAISA